MTTLHSSTKIAILCLPGLQSFLSDIVEWLEPRCDIRICYSDNPQEIAAAVSWADIIWLEWANAVAAGLTRNTALLENKHVICRLHSYEVFESSLAKIEWSRIGDLICIAPHILEIATQRVPDLERLCGRISIIPNGIDLHRFTFKRRQKGFNLAYLGYINYKKGPMLLLQILKALVRIDSRYSLSIAGRIQDARYSLYFKQMIAAMELTANIRFDGWVDDVNNWLADKDYILCTSIFESQGMGVMEAMACGIKPIIHNFVGAHRIYPSAYLWDSVPEGVDLIRSETYDSAEYRRWIEHRYSLGEQLCKLGHLFNTCCQGRQRRESGSVIVVSPEFVSNTPDTIDAATPPALPPQVEATLRKCVQPGMRVLDMGWGSGAAAQFMASLGAAVTVVDPSPAAIAAAQRDGDDRRIKCRLTEYSQLNLPSAFDVVTIIDTLQMISGDEMDPFIKTVARHLSVKGVVYLNGKDGRYLDYVHDRKDAAADQQLVAHLPESILSAFARNGLLVYHINLYGETRPMDSGEYLFTTRNAFRRTFGTES